MNKRYEDLINEGGEGYRASDYEDQPQTPTKKILDTLKNDMISKFDCLCRLTYYKNPHQKSSREIIKHYEDLSAMFN